MSSNLFDDAAEEDEEPEQNVGDEAEEDNGDGERDDNDDGDNEDDGDDAAKASLSRLSDPKLLTTWAPDRKRGATVVYMHFALKSLFTYS